MDTKVESIEQIACSTVDERACSKRADGYKDE